MSPRWRRRLAGGATLLTLVLWPISALTWARDEPQTVLGLSWLAMTISCGTLWAATDVREHQEEGER